MVVKVVDDIVRELDKASPSGDGWVCCCPAHDDEDPSLSITEAANGKILVKCHAGCSQEKVIDELKDRGLWTDTETTETTYDYVDANDNLLYQVVRSKDKSFRQRRPDGNDGWVWSVKGIEKVPYRLPQLLTAIKAGQTIFIAEGEKDCDNLALLGLPATTNSGGAGKWSDQLSQYVKGAKEVIILPDNDQPGGDHANKVATSLNKLRVPVKIVPLPGVPEKGDVSDWLNAGGNKEQLLQLSADTPNWGTDNNNNICQLINNTDKTQLDWADPATFGEPILFDEIETPDISSDFLPAWAKDYVDAVADQTQTPIGMGSMQVLAILAACLQKRYTISPYGDDHSEPLSLWTLVALPPASRKTAVLSALREPVIEWEALEAQRLAPEIEYADTQRDVILKQIDTLKKQASQAYGRGLDDHNPNEHNKSPEKLMKEIQTLKDNMLEVKTLPKIFVTDITPESLQNELAANGERLAIITDEGNIFEIMAGLYSDGKSNADVFLQGHSGGPVRVKRSTRDVHLNNIALSIGLAVQPQVLAELKTGNKRAFRGKGILARFLYYLPKSNIGKRNIRERKVIPPQLKEAYINGIKALLKIKPIVDSQGNETPRKLRLTDEALESWLQFSEWLEHELGDGGKFEYLQDWAGKLPGQALRAAGLCHVAKLINTGADTYMPLREKIALSALSTLSSDPCENDLLVSKETIEPILELCKKLIPHTQAVFDNLMGDDETVADAKYTLKWLLTNTVRDDNGRFFIKQNSLHGTGRFKNSDVNRVIKVLDMLQRRNILSPLYKLPTPKPTYIRYVNPDLCTNHLTACA